MSAPRPVDLARLGLGAVALGRPRLLLRLADAPDERRVRVAVRVLGARYVLQAAGGTAFGRRWAPAADAGVDLVHAASMLGVAAFAPWHRRLALASAVVAGGFAAADLSDPGA